MINLDILEQRAKAATGIKWTYNHELAWLNAEDPEDGEIYTIANLFLDSTSDGKCYGASRNGAFIAAAHPQRIIALIQVARAAQEAYDASTQRVKMGEPDSAERATAMIARAQKAAQALKEALEHLKGIP